MKHSSLRSWVLMALLGAVMVGLAAVSLSPALRASDDEPMPMLTADGPAMPEFTRRGPEAWLNTAPLKAAEFRGKVVLLEVYASG